MLETLEPQFWSMTYQERISPQEAFDLYDELDAVELDDMMGVWRGFELHTGHPMEGALENLHWYGKAFHSVNQVDPLLFYKRNGNIFAADPGRIFDKMKIVPSDGGEGRLRMVEHRGRITATLLYDHLPIMDHFRRVSPDVLMGYMDMKGNTEPYFFYLNKLG
jgi:hypothetical protein